MLTFLNKSIDQKSARIDKSSVKAQTIAAPDGKALSDAELAQVSGGRMLNPQPLPPRYR